MLLYTLEIWHSPKFGYLHLAYDPTKKAGRFAPTYLVNGDAEVPLKDPVDLSEPLKYSQDIVASAIPSGWGSLYLGEWNPEKLQQGLAEDPEHPVNKLLALLETEPTV